MTATALDTPSREDLVAAARDLFPTIRAASATAEKARRLPADVFAALRDAGFFRMLVPRRYGGLEYGPETAAQVVIELAAACGSTGWVGACGISHQWMAAQFPLECHDEVWADGPDKFVATSFPPTGECAAADGGFRVGGTWRYASGCDHADFALLGVKFPPRDGAGVPMPGFVIVPAAEFDIVDDWDTMGLAGTGSHAVRLEDVFVPAHRSITLREFFSGSPPGQQAFETNLGRFPLFAVGANLLAVTPVGCLQGGLDDFVSNLKTWETRGTAMGAGEKVMDFPTVQLRVGQASAALLAAKTLLFSRMEFSRQAVMERGEPLTRDQRMENKIAQTNAVQIALRGLEDIWAVAGAHGIHNTGHLQRAWRDAQAIGHHVFFNWDAACVMQGQHLLGLEPEGMF